MRQCLAIYTSSASKNANVQQQIKTSVKIPLLMDRLSDEIRTSYVNFI